MTPCGQFLHYTNLFFISPVELQMTMHLEISHGQELLLMNSLFGPENSKLTELIMKFCTLQLDMVSHLLSIFLRFVEGS